MDYKKCSQTIRSKDQSNAFRLVESDVLKLAEASSALECMKFFLTSGKWLCDNC